MPEGDGPTAPREVEAAGKKYTISKFKGFKAFRIGKQLTELGEIGPEIQKAVSKFINEYRAENVEKIPRATLEFRYPAEAAAVSEKAWEVSGNVIELAQDPGQAEILAITIPKAFELAGDRVVDLLAWVVSDDKVLQEKDLAGGEDLEAYIKEIKSELLYNADLDELLELAFAAQDVISEQMAGKAERARKLLAVVGLGETEAEPPAETEEEPQPKPAEVIVPDEEKPETPSSPESTSTSPRPDLSTDSPPPTDGDDERSSTASTGEPSTSISA